MTLEINRGSCKFIMGITDPAQLSQWFKQNSKLTGVAFVGRSNAGKSSLINRLFGNTTARTSKTPGRTRQINIFTFELGDAEKTYHVFDLPGYGHAEVSKEMGENWKQLVNVFFKYCPESVMLIDIQDSRHPNQEVDKVFSDYIARFGLTTTLVFNKIDKLKRQSDRAEFNQKKAAMLPELKWAHDIFCISAEKGDGCQELLDSLVSFLLGH